MSFSTVSLPAQQLPFTRKTRKWRKANLDWADSKTFFNYSPVRHSVVHKKINYDLVNGKLHMQDLEYTINPDNIQEKVTPNDIQHYPVMNSKLNVLIGEERARVFDYRVVVTNPNALSEREENKKNEILQTLQQMVADQSQSDEEYQEGLKKMEDFFTYQWQDMREVRANCLLNHYIKEYNMPLMFNDGFKDGLTVGEEIYQCDIVGGEPVVYRLNPMKVRIFRSGYSNKIEDADVIILEDYWSPGKVTDVYYDVLTPKDRDYIENSYKHLDGAEANEVGEIDERLGFVNKHMIDDTIGGEDYLFDPFGAYESANTDLMPWDTNGNVRVLRMYWKSRRKIKKVKSYNPETGEEEFNFYPETYIIDESKGEEEKIFYINEAWEGTKIGKDIYVNMRPRLVQYNRLSNPSRCHFGIIGSVYNLNDSRPFSMVDMMKPFNYLYDVVHDRLNKVMARNWGRIIKLDLALVPDGWDIDKWLYYAKHMNMAVVDSFKEGNVGAATGKIAGALNTNSSGVIDAELGGIVQQYIQTLEYIKQEMADVVGISRQREGQISNRETVGGVERATLQSSHITEWVFATHDDVKKRVLECFLETAKIALRGRKEKFQYLLSDGAMKVMEIDGDEFAEADYGLIVDSSNNMQELNQKLETLAQAALQNQTLSFASIMKLFSSASLIEKQRIIEKDEQQRMEMQQQQQQQQMELQQQQMELQAQAEQARMEQQDRLNQRDNETKILVAQIGAAAWDKDGDKEEDLIYTEQAKEELAEKMRQFDEKTKLEREKLDFNKKKADQDYDIKKRQLRQKSNNK